VIGDAGLIVPENDSAALAAQLQRLLRDENLRKTLAEAGRQRTAENFTWERAAEQIFALYQCVLKSKKLCS